MRSDSSDGAGTTSVPSGHEQCPIAARDEVRPLRRSGSAEHVDHDHQTGRVRGVRCFSRRAAPGQFKDRPDVVGRAAAYVEGNLWKPTLVAQGVYRQPS
ncbi:endonuclease domain-containing protein [Streptomyces avidinii]|uniref:endonuclease domain-containing protein n=1 Tax=Streptomyces avidinii TaxID=1895 RepID=UPI00386F4056